MILQLVISDCPFLFDIDFIENVFTIFDIFKFKTAEFFLQERLRDQNDQNNKWCQAALAYPLWKRPRLSHEPPDQTL